jgi:hypothetical protein
MILESLHTMVLYSNYLLTENCQFYVKTLIVYDPSLRVAGAAGAGKSAAFACSLLAVYASEYILRIPRMYII